MTLNTTTHATTGRPFRSHMSEALSRAFLGTPDGWTVCGFLGLIAATTPFVGKLGAILVDLMLIERGHCYEAMLRSIDRAKEARHARIEQAG